MSPTAQLAYATAVALFGAWLIAMWAVGLLLIVFAGLVMADAVLRDGRSDDRSEPESRHEEIMEHWRRAR